MLPDKYEKFDRIILNTENIEFMNNYMNEIAEVELHIPLNKGVLIIEKWFNSEADVFFPFWQDRDTLVIEIFTEEFGKKRIAKVEVDSNGKIDIVDTIMMDLSFQHLSFQEKQLMIKEIYNFANLATNALVRVFYLMITYKEQKVVTLKEKTIHVSKNKTNKNKKNKSISRKIKRVEYKLSSEVLEQMEITAKRKRYTRHTNSWARRGIGDNIRAVSAFGLNQLLLN
ncbi:hypothetical protein CG481_022470 (plasmid) [Bacillus cytotoxicus]|uniref:hypothetical protein n=1 Tax=Bacillus cytotoxicus TaxID=580165 RepID=UPI000BC57C17|nr:hypothetical protein [Bacillus cytotoxicus]AWC39064.1 hypothetical protein CG481_022470 [Bacillus cytotoxicus]